MRQKSKISLFDQRKFSSTFSSSSSSSNEDIQQDVSIGEADEFGYRADTAEGSTVFVAEQCDPISWVTLYESYCFDVERFADKLIKATYVEAIRRLRPKPKRITSFDIVEPLIDHIINLVTRTEVNSDAFPDQISGVSDGSCDVLSSLKDVEWPKISEFTIKLGLETLEEYVLTWEGLQDWLFCIEFLGFECEDCSNVFVYEVEWSQPTKAYPIPQVTASVYFALEVFKMIPFKNDRSVDVTYIFEGSNVIHIPGRIDFQEKWLQDVIDVKMNKFQRFVFSTLPGALKCQVKRRRLSGHISQIFEKHY